MAEKTVAVRGEESGQTPAVVARAEKVVKAYRRGAEVIQALKGVDLTLMPGEFVCLLGPSGAGKTTTLNLLGLMDWVTSGRLTVVGHPVGEGAGRLSEETLDRIRRENIGFIFQQFYLMPTLSALENVAMPQLWTGKPNRARARELLERVGLGHRVGHRPAELSGGEQQRVAVARALVNHPRLVLADEPTGNLDTRTRDDILRLFQELAGEGLTILLATHDQEVATHAHRVVRLDEGRVCE